MAPNSTTPILGDGTPMPGENFENRENREQTGENLNPNLSQEEIDKFNSLENVEFAGDKPQTQPTGSSAAETVIGNQLNSGSPNLEGAKETLGANFIDGAATEAIDSLNAQASIADSEHNSNSKAAADAEMLTIAAATTAVAASAKADKIKNDLRAGDAEAAAQANDVIRKAEKAQTLAESATTAVAMSGLEAPRSIVNVAAAAQAEMMSAKTIKEVTEAKAEGESLSEEDRQIAQEASKRAEANNTELDTEIEKIKAEKADEEEQNNKKEQDNQEEPVLDPGILR